MYLQIISPTQKSRAKTQRRQNRTELEQFLCFCLYLKEVLLLGTIFSPHPDPGSQKIIVNISLLIVCKTAKTISLLKSDPDQQH